MWSMLWPRMLVTFYLSNRIFNRTHTSVYYFVASISVPSPVGFIWLMSYIIACNCTVIDMYVQAYSYSTVNSHTSIMTDLLFPALCCRNHPIRLCISLQQLFTECPCLQHDASSMHGRHVATCSRSKKFQTFQFFPILTKLPATDQQQNISIPFAGVGLIHWFFSYFCSRTHSFQEKRVCGE